MNRDIAIATAPQPMTRRSWTTAEQQDWLQQWMPEYSAERGHMGLQRFWGAMYEAWFQRFPEEEAEAGQGMVRRRPDGTPMTSLREARVERKKVCALCCSRKG